jgi:hypothetical protein
MARSGLRPRKQRRLERLARWLETLWSCQCMYRNVATYRCHGCGRRPPRTLRLRVERVPPLGELGREPTPDPVKVHAEP